jgi:diguanylate cyclase (GGDEF)-like protein
MRFVKTILNLLSFSKQIFALSGSPRRKNYQAALTKFGKLRLSIKWSGRVGATVSSRADANSRSSKAPINHCRLWLKFMRSLSIFSERRNAMAWAVALRTAGILLLLAVVIGGILHFSTSRSDALALGRQNKLVALAISQSITAIANDQEASTYWDDAVIRTRQRPLDMEWLDNNLGVWFHTYYKHDETYLLDPHNQPVYAMQNGVRFKPMAFRKLSETALPLARALRRKLAVARLAPDGSPGKTVGVTEITVIDRRPAIISLKPIISETGDIVQPPGSEYLHASVRYLDRSFLTNLATLYGIDEARFSRSPKGAASIPVTGSHGSTLGYIVWDPFEPGEQVEDKMVPALFAALFIVGLIISLLFARVARSRMELEVSRAQAQHLAFHDSLTGLPNRALFDDRLAHALARRGCRAAVLLLDLDRFKHVNDTLGHQAGDALIREFGVRLAGLTRDGDTIARLGGDEFAILLEDAGPQDVHRLAARILKDVARPFDILGSHLHIGVSIGVALTSEAGTDRLEIVRKADIALYRAKDGGRNNYCLFNASMDETVKLRSSIEEDLREALSSGVGLCLYYQTQIGNNGRIIGLEALIRWNHPTRGLIAPEQFISVAEESGLIVPLGEWVLREACLASLRCGPLFVAVNLSPVQLRAQGFFDSLMRIVRRAGADPSSIQLELTERVLLDDDDSVRTVLSQLRAAGFTIVLDDFGTGYSSLSYLRKFEVDKIKIDRSFVQHLGEASDSAAIVTAVLALGRAMGLSVAAEGVETPEQRAFLDIAGCKEMQGYYFSRPVPADELAELFGGTNSSTAAA